MANFTGISITDDGFCIVKDGQLTVSANQDGTIYMDGGLYAGGTVFSASSVPANRIAVYSPSVWVDDDVEFSLPSRRCSYCGSRGEEDKYHSGTCANCGAIL